VVDSAGNTVSDFNGTVDVSETDGAYYSQNGSTPQAGTNGVSYPVTVTNGTATLDVGQIMTPGLSVDMTTTGLTSPNGQSVVSSPSYGTATITSSPQVATSLKIVPASSSSYLDANAVNSASMSVLVLDQAGYPMLAGTDSVTVNVTGPATFAGASTNPLSIAYSGYSTVQPDPATGAGDTNDSAQFSVYSVQGETGPITISASASGLTAATATLTAVIAGAPSQMATSLSANSFAQGPSGTTGINLQLQAEDANGVPVAVPNTNGEQVQVTVYPSGSTSPAANINVGTPRQTTEDLNMSGGTSYIASVGAGNNPAQVSVPITNVGTGADAGTYTVTVAPVSNAAYSFPTQTLTFTETAGAVSSVGFTPGAVNVPFSNPSATYTLQLQDEFGNPVADAGQSLTVTATASSPEAGTATLNGVSSPLTVTTNAKGQATVTLKAQPLGVDGESWTVSASGTVNGTSVAGTSGPMTIVNQVPGSVSVGLQDTDYNQSSSAMTSTSDAVAGDPVTAAITVNNQYGSLMVSQPVNLTITVPAGLSGSSSIPTAVYTTAPGQASVDGWTSTSWNKGQSNTLTFNGYTNAQGQVVVTGLQAWTAGSATLSATANDVTSPVSGSAQIYVQTGRATQVGLFYNGTAITSSNSLSVTANTPVALTVEPEDIAGNPTAATYGTTVMLDAAGGAFLPTETGAPITTVKLAPGQSSATVYYVNGTSGSYEPSATSFLMVYANPSVANGASATVTAAVYGENSLEPTQGSSPLPGQTVTAAVEQSGAVVGSLTPTTTDSEGAATFTYTAPSLGTGTVTVTITVNGLSQNVTIAY
jgi:hypothetical protein